MNTNIIDYGQYNTTWTSPKTVTKEKKTVTKEFDSKGRVTKETEVTEIVTETVYVTNPYTPSWTTTTNSSNVKYGVTLQKDKE